MLTNISGFPELLPKQQQLFNHQLQTIQKTFELFGFTALDTPAIEKISTLLAKGNDNEIYGIFRLAETGATKKELGLRFDLTVPLARYVSQYYGQLTFPFRRYHIGKVWRGERPQAGRFRELYQCDIDIIGDTELSYLYDAELLIIIEKIFLSIIGSEFKTKINNRKILSGLIKSFGIIESDVAHVIKVIDKVDKISKEQFEAELKALLPSNKAIETVASLLELNFTNKEWLTYLKSLSENEEFQQGINELEFVFEAAIKLGASEKYIQIDPTLARGLNYYTGTVYETKLNAYPTFGSVCGGGRYANLAETFSNKKLPGVGVSIGLSRLFSKLLENDILDLNIGNGVIVTIQDKIYLEKYFTIAQNLRNAFIQAEVFLEDKALGTQMKYASKKGFRFAIIAGELEFKNDSVSLRDLKAGTQELVALDTLITHIKAKNI